MPDATAAPPAPTTIPTITEGADKAPSSSPAPTTPDSGALPPVAPQAPAYALKLPEKATLSPEAIERMTAIARASGLSNEAAQKALDFADAEAAASAAEHLKTAQAAWVQANQPGGAEYEKLVEGWKKSAYEDNALGKTEAEREASIGRGRAVIDKYVEAHPKLGADMKDFLHKSGIAYHPSVVRFFVWLGRSAAEPQTLDSGTAGAGKESADDQLRKMYPSMYPPAA